MSLEADVFRYLEHNQDVNIHVRDIADAVAMTETQVRNVMYRLEKRHDIALIRVLQGVWRLSSSSNGATPTQSGKRIFEEIGEARDESVIIQDQDGRIYRALEL